MPADTNEIPKPISSDALAWEAWGDLPRFSGRVKHLSNAAVGHEDYRVGVLIEELPPGKQSCPLHYHIFEEEHVYVLQGRVTVRLGGEEHDMVEGDYICFPAGQRAGHCLINNTSEPCRYVVIGERNRNEVAVYPDSNKVLVRAERKLLDLAATMGYWDREDTGLPAGEVPAEDEPPAPGPAEHPFAPVAEGDVEWMQEGVPGSSHFGGRSKHLTYAAVGEAFRVGVLIESPAPGMRLCPTHYHMLEEEHALVLEGTLTLVLGDARHEMKAGDYVCFPAGQRIGHSFINSGTGPCRYLMIGNHSPNDVCVYPDSGKVIVKALAPEPVIFDMAATRSYWEGEET